MKARVGSISSGTMRTEDLLGSFASELKNLLGKPGEDNRTGACAEDANWRGKFEALIKEAEDCEDFDSEEASFILEELFEALDSFAPPYCYFGVCDGDGADYGFWPSQDAIAELPRVNDSDEAKRLGEDCVFVNDHGNVTIYNGQGESVLELV